MRSSRRSAADTHPDVAQRGRERAARAIPTAARSSRPGHTSSDPGHLAKRDITQLTVLVKTRLRQMQDRPGQLSGFLAKTHLDLTPLL